MEGNNQGNQMDEFEELYRKLKETYDTGRIRVKRRIQRAKFTTYFFHERKRVDWWNRSCQLVKFGFFRFSFKIRRDFKNRLYDMFLKNVLPLYRAAEKTVAEGWQWEQITVQQYNAIVFYVDFCRKLLAYGDARSAQGKEFLIAEEAYLRLVCNDMHLAVLEDGLRNTLARRGKVNAETREKTDQAIVKLTGFFVTNGSQPSFLDFCLAYNMAESRKYLTFSDIVSSSVGVILSPHFYDCPLDVFKAIMTYYRTLNTEIKELQGRIEWLEWLDRQSSFRGDEEPDELVSFYNAPKGNWLVDSKNYYGLLFSQARKLTALLESVLFKEWDVMTDEEKVIRSRILDNEDLASLFEDLKDSLTSADSYYRKAFPTAFSLAEFRRGTVHESIVTTKPYHELKDKLDLVLTILYHVAISLDEMSTDSTYTGAFLFRYMIVRPVEYRGKSVMDLLVYLTGLLLKSCRFFLSSELLTELKEAEPSRQSLDAKQKLRDHIDIEGIISELIAGIEFDELPDA